MAHPMTIWAAETPSGVELTVWWWVIAIGVGAIVSFYLVKRISEVVVKRRTDDLVRQIDEESRAEDQPERD